MSEIIAEGIIEARTLRQYVETFLPLVSEARVHFNDDGLSVRVVDPGNVAMIDPGELAYRAFESYDSPGTATVGVMLERLHERLKPADPDQLAKISVDMETRHLHVDYGSAHQEIVLIDPENIRKEPDVDAIDLPNEVTLTGEQLDHALTIMDMVSDHAIIRGEPENDAISFTSRGDTDNSSVEYTAADCIDMEIAGAVESVFSMEYLKELAKPIPDDAGVGLRFGDEFPMTLDWGAAEGWITVHQVLAPRIQKT